MRDYARIWCQFWVRGTGRKLRGNHAAQALAMYLMSTGHGNMAGLYYLPLPTMLHELGMAEPTARDSLDLFADLDLAHHDAEAELAYLPTAPRYQLGLEDTKLPLKTGDKKIAGVVREVIKHQGHRFFDDFVARWGTPLNLPTEVISAARTPFHGLNSAPLTPLEGVPRVISDTPPPLGSKAHAQAIAPAKERANASDARAGSLSPDPAESVFATFARSVCVADDDDAAGLMSELESVYSRFDLIAEAAACHAEWGQTGVPIDQRRFRTWLGQRNAAAVDAHGAIVLEPEVRARLDALAAAAGPRWFAWSPDSAVDDAARAGLIRAINGGVSVDDFRLIGEFMAAGGASYLTSAAGPRWLVGKVSELRDKARAWAATGRPAVAGPGVKGTSEPNYQERLDRLLASEREEAEERRKRAATAARGPSQPKRIGED